MDDTIVAWLPARMVVTDASASASVAAGAADVASAHSAWSPVRRGKRWLSTYLSHRRLYPLWRALHATHPDIALLPARGPFTDALAVVDLDLRLYRRVIEIRDGLLLLRPYAGPDVLREARAHAEAGLSGLSEAEIPAYLEAVSLVAALQAYPTAGSDPFSAATAWADWPAGPDGTGDGDLQAEIAHLTRVARHLRPHLATLAAQRVKRDA